MGAELTEGIAAFERLLEIGPPSDILEHAPAEAASAVGLDRTLLSRIDDGVLVPVAVWVRDDDGEPASDLLHRAREARVPLQYPLLEGEVLRRRRPQVAGRADDEPAERQAYAAVFAWTEYLVAPVVLDGGVIGFLHGDRTTGDRPLDDGDARALGVFATLLAVVYERAVLRHRLRVQRQEMRNVATWADARTSELSEGAVRLSPDDEPRTAPREAAGSPDALRDLLTRREIDVLELMVKGETNAGIARALVLSDGTVKFHVKNILRKMHVANRAEATARYLRLTLGRADAPR